MCLSTKMWKWVICKYCEWVTWNCPRVIYFCVHVAYSVVLVQLQNMVCIVRTYTYAHKYYYFVCLSVFHDLCMKWVPDGSQQSFVKVEQEKNLCERHKIVKASRKWTLKRRNSDPWTFINEGDHVKNTTEGHYLIQEVIMKKEEKAHPLDSDVIF